MIRSTSHLPPRGHKRTQQKKYSPYFARYTKLAPFQIYRNGDGGFSHLLPFAIAMGRVRGGVVVEEEAAGDSDSVAVPMEDTVQALIDHLVYPLLPSKASFHDSPTLSKQKSVAMQVFLILLLLLLLHMIINAL